MAHLEFIPEEWGCIGFKIESRMNGFIERTGVGSIFAIYLTKQDGDPSDDRGKVVGFVEISNKTDHISNLASEESIQRSQGRWLHGVEVTHAWRVIQEHKQVVETIFLDTYDPNSGQTIAAQGRHVKETNFNNIKELEVRAVNVYGQPPLPDAEPEIETVEDILRVREIQLYQQDGKPKKPKPMTGDDIVRASRAGPISKDGYFVKDPDGERYLYILKLKGSPENWLGENPFFDIRNRIIVKIGFSHDPQKRKRQIQSSYPLGQFEWDVMFPTEFIGAHAPNGDTALIGEAAMKKFFYEHPDAESLGGEFYLVPKNICKKCFDAGLEAIA